MNIKVARKIKDIDGLDKHWSSRATRRATLRSHKKLVPKVSDTVVEIKNIAPDYLRFIDDNGQKQQKLLSSRVHYQGKIFWGTTSTYHPTGTEINSEPVQVPRKVRHTYRPQYLAKPINKKYKRFSTGQTVPGWLETYEWSHKYFYPKEGGKILKKRKFPLSRKPTIILGGGHFRPSIYKFMIGFWAQDTSPHEVRDSRPVSIEYKQPPSQFRARTRITPRPPTGPIIQIDTTGNRTISTNNYTRVYQTAWLRGCETSRSLYPTINNYP